MSIRAWIACLCTSFTALAGCVTTPTPAEGLASAYSVGDRARTAFDEVVVSLQMPEANAPYQNLHVAVTAFINPIRKTPADPWQAQEIVQRCEPRIAVRLSRVLGSQAATSLHEAKRLRELARSEAQAVVDEAMKRWEHGPDYQVEVAVASLYWTDASVGQSAQARRGWW